MPGGDKTGPAGDGPMTGRGAGPCGENAEQMSTVQTAGRACRLRRGRRWGLRRRHRFGLGGSPGSPGDRRDSGPEK